MYSKFEQSSASAAVTVHCVAHRARPRLLWPSNPIPGYALARRICMDAPRFSGLHVPMRVGSLMRSYRVEGASSITMLSDTVYSRAMSFTFVVEG